MGGHPNESSTIRQRPDGAILTSVPAATVVNGTSNQVETHGSLALARVAAQLGDVRLPLIVVDDSGRVAAINAAAASALGAPASELVGSTLSATASPGSISSQLGQLEQTLTTLLATIESARRASELASMPGVRLDHQMLDQLSERERVIVQRVLSGYRVPSIAAELYLSQSTVRNHLSSAFRKLGVHSQAELLERARHGGDQPPL